jgi:hypothetical protein
MRRIVLALTGAVVAAAVRAAPAVANHSWGGYVPRAAMVPAVVLGLRVGVVIVALALRVLYKWVRGDYRPGAHGVGGNRDRHLRRGPGAQHAHVRVRSPRQALAIGTLHGLAGTGTIVLLLLAALPSQLEAAAALAVFAPMSVLSMAACTTVFAGCSPDRSWSPSTAAFSSPSSARSAWCSAPGTSASHKALTRGSHPSSRRHWCGDRDEREDQNEVVVPHRSSSLSVQVRPDRRDVRVVAVERRVVGGPRVWPVNC